ncbi:MAG: histidine phosphatase family protein [Candidatus Rokubacteria bacterium]|nr:histidine phosphatase family protein [Candidatus Rokubacteria bacterium]
MIRALGAALALLALPASAGAADGLWELLRAGGQVVLLPHATTGGAPGDPAGFRLADCTTQRNLSAAGREEARRIGRAFRARRIPVASVMSSRWCRCLETALLAFDRVEPWPALDSFSGRAPASSRSPAGCSCASVLSSKFAVTSGRVARAGAGVG